MKYLKNSIDLFVTSLFVSKSLLLVMQKVIFVKRLCGVCLSLYAVEQKANAHEATPKLVQPFGYFAV